MKNCMRAIAALLVTSALSSPALGQDYTPPGIPPIRQTVDPMGVDLTRGAIAVAGTHRVSIGPAGSAGLSWSRTVAGGIAFYDSSAILLNVNGTTYTVSVGASSESFTLTGSNYVPGQGTGSTLVLSGSNYIYTTRDGAVYTLVPFTNANKQYQGSYYGSSVTRPTGEVETYNWETVSGICHWNAHIGACTRGNGQRLRSVTSTNGYKIAFTFQVEDPSSSEGPTPGWASIATVQAQNMQVSPTGHTWPTLTFTGQVFINSSWSVADGLSPPRTTTYTYSPDGSGYYPILFKVQRPGASSANEVIGYNTSGLVAGVTLNGVTDSYNYSTVGTVLTTTVTDPNSNTRVVKVDTTTGLVSSDTNERGKTTSYTYYSPSGLLHTATAPEGNYATYYYDNRGNLTQTTVTPKSGSPLSPINSYASYPASDPTNTWMCASGPTPVQCNKPNTTTDAMGNVTNYVWESASGLPTSVTLPAPTTGAVRPQTRYTYTSVYGQYLSGSSLVNFATPVTRLSTISKCRTTASCSGGSDEVKSSIAYSLTGVTNSNALPLQVSKGFGNVALPVLATSTWDLIGNVVSVDGPLTTPLDVTAYFYDADRELLGTAGPGDPNAKNRATRLTYNLDGQVTKAEVGTVPNQSSITGSAFTSLAETDTAYDANARPTTVGQAGSGTTKTLTQTTYDNMGRVDCTTVRMNDGAFTSLPSSACTLGTTGTYGPDRVTKMAYDATSNPTKITTAYGLADQSDRVTLTYSDNGLVNSLKDGQGNITTYTPDGFDRPSTTTYADTKTQMLGHDPNSNITSFTTRNSEVINFGYDNLNRRTALSSSAVANRTYTYDLLNEQLSATFTTGGQGITNSYDAYGNVTASTTNVGGTSRTMSYAYNLVGMRTNVMWWDGFNVEYDRLATGEASDIWDHLGSSSSHLESYTYNDFGEPLTDTRGNSTALGWGYDVIGRPTSLSIDLGGGTTNDLAITNTLSPASQVVSQFRNNDTYSWTGAANGSTAYVANNLNQYSSVGGTTNTSDTNGNLHTDAASSFTYNYDALNRPTSTSTSLGSAAMTYDPADRLDTYSGNLWSRFIYDGNEVVAQLDSSGNFQGRYVRGDGPDQLLAIYSDSTLTNKRFAYLDERNSVIATADPTTGTLQSINRYSEYGVPQSTNTGLFQYTGQMWWPDAILQYSKARVYKPQLGRFLQMDPVGVNGGINLYNYTGNDPVNATDPKGLLHYERQCKTAVGPEGPDGSFSVYPTDCIYVQVIDPWDRFGGTTIVDVRVAVGESGENQLSLGVGIPSLPQRPSYCNSGLYQIGNFLEFEGSRFKSAGTGIVGGGLVGAGVGGTAGFVSGGPAGAAAGASPGLAVAGLGADIYLLGTNFSLAGNALEGLAGNQRSIANVVSSAFDKYAESMTAKIPNLGKVFIGNGEDLAANSVQGTDPCD